MEGGLKTIGLLCREVGAASNQNPGDRPAASSPWARDLKETEKGIELNIIKVFWDLTERENNNRTRGEAKPVGSTGRADVSDGAEEICQIWLVAPPSFRHPVLIFNEQSPQPVSHREEGATFIFSARNEEILSIREKTKQLFVTSHPKK